MSEIHKISAWVRVAFAVIGFLIGFAAGLSATPVVGTILPLLFAVIGGGAGLFLSKAPHNSKEIGISVALLAMMCLAGSVWGIHLRTASGLRCFITLCAEPTEQYADEIKIPTDENDPEVIANLIAIRADLLRISVPQKDRKRLYELARQGLDVERQPREVMVHAIALESMALPDLVIRVRCGKGFYVRTLAADLGAALGPGGSLASLQRTRVGPYRLEAAVPWETVQEARDGGRLWPQLLPPDSALMGMPELRLAEAPARAFLHGQAVAAEGDADPADGALLRVYGPDGTFLGIGSRRGPSVKPDRLLHADPSRARVLPA